VSEPYTHKTKIEYLYPTQFNVGMDEVKRKRAAWNKKTKEVKSGYLKSFVVPVIYGPGYQYHLVDHHHECLALHLEGQVKVRVHVLADLNELHANEFYSFMISSGWMYPFDNGVFKDPLDFPLKVGKLTDDPYRSLAGLVRDKGGFAKTDVPFSEFKWANFFRSCKCKSDDVTLAMDLAKRKIANYLPGWVGVR
jgi:hypothetical protein